jgi:hypothetical protein
MDRRSFLKKLGLGAAAVPLAGKVLIDSPHVIDASTGLAVPKVELIKNVREPIVVPSKAEPLKMAEMDGMIVTNFIISHRAEPLYWEGGFSHEYLREGPRCVEVEIHAIATYDSLINIQRGSFLGRGLGANRCKMTMFIEYPEGD